MFQFDDVNMALLQLHLSDKQFCRLKSTYIIGLKGFIIDADPLMEYGKWWYIHITFILDLFEVSYSIVSRNLMPFYMCKHSQYVPSPGPGRINIGYRPSAYESILYPNMFFSDGKQK